MNNPRCPYCGEEMLLHEVLGEYFYMCKREGCKSMAPMHSSEEAAYAAAVERERPKGEWIEAQEYLFDSVYTCSACGSVFVLESGTPKDNEYNFCPFCGADMREEEDE